MTQENKIDLFTVGLVIGEDGKVKENNNTELIAYLEDSEFIKPVNYHFLIALPTVEEKTRGGIILADSTKEAALVGNNIGRVIGKGGTVGGATGNYKDCQELEIGDYIGYNPHAGLPENCGGHRVICMADDAIKIVIPNPAKHTDGIFNAYAIRGVSA